jgi:hypothetical protein
VRFSQRYFSFFCIRFRARGAQKRNTAKRANTMLPSIPSLTRVRQSDLRQRDRTPADAVKRLAIRHAKVR